MGKQDSVLWTIERRPCGACKHFKLDFGASVLGLCSKKLMTVTAITCIQYKNETFFETTFILSQYFNIKQNENSKSNEI